MFNLFKDFEPILSDSFHRIDLFHGSSTEFTIISLLALDYSPIAAFLLKQSVHFLN